MKKLAGILAAVLALIVAYFAYYSYMDKKAKETVERFFSRTLKKTGEVSYGKVDYKPLSGETVIEKVRYKDRNGEELSIDRIIIRKLTDTEGEFLFRGVRPLKRRSLLEEYGYKDPHFNLFISYETEPEKRLFRLNHLSVNYPQAFEVNLSLTLGNYDHSFWKTVALSDRPSEEMSFQVLSELGSLKLNSLEVLYLDKGLKRRVIEKEAQKRGKTYEEFKKELIKQIHQAKARVDSQFERNLLDAFEKFIKEGKEIKLVIKPNPPAKIQDIFVIVAVQKNEKGLIRLLNPVVEVK